MQATVAVEFAKRLSGISYAEISKQGGGIYSTVEKTRAATEIELYEQSLPRIKALVDEGVCTVEIKSGYGLDLDAELKMLNVAQQLGKKSRARIYKTFWGAHAIPKENLEDPDAYVEMICKEFLPAVRAKNLASAVDVFCEKIAFNLEQTTKILAAAKALDFELKIHAGQLSDLGGARIAAEYGALSADHLEYIDEETVKIMAQKGDGCSLIARGLLTIFKKNKNHQSNYFVNIEFQWQ